MAPFRIRMERPFWSRRRSGAGSIAGMGRGLIALLVSALVCGCAGTIVQQSVPGLIVNQAQIAGFAQIRTWGDGAPQQWVMPSGSSRSSQRNYLALSGGGSEGAYGAGLLVGWTATGQRPEFALVTGVSTGALAAPFAFLGSDYDDKLREIYTQYSTSDLATPQFFSALLGGASLVDSTGLERLLTRYVDGFLIAEIAREHSLGRRLLVATTNVEAERQVIWDMGAIASSKHPDAPGLFRRVLLASAAIPGVFSPVLITVRVDGNAYSEMHADGGMVGQVFFPRSATNAVNVSKKVTAGATLYVVRNGKLGPEWQAIEPTALRIAGRSLGTLIKNQARGDVERLYTTAKQVGMTFKLAAIPASFVATPAEPFDVAYMRTLFNLGYREAVAGYRWADAPP